MAHLVFFAAFVLNAALHAVGQPPADFLSIDCGLEANYSGYKDPNTGIVYVSDEPYVDSGENHRIAADQESRWSDTNLRTLRSFPSGVRNCYSLPTRTGTRYLVRLSFVHGNYDGDAGWTTLRFDLYLGVNRWATVEKDYDHEAVFMAWASWAPVCLVNTGSGTPFVSLVELRPLDDALYQSVMANQSMARYVRCSIGDNKKVITRYPDDQYDRYWWQLGYTSPTWKNLSTVSAIKQDSIYTVPSTIIQTAVEAVGNNTMLNITWQDTTTRGYGLKFFMYFADFQNSQLRQFNVSLNDVEPYQYSPPYLTSDVLYNSGWSTATDGNYNISLVPTAASKLPPMINALEIYTLIPHHSPMTFPADYATKDPPRDKLELENAPERRQNHGDVLQIVENRQFTYNELEKVTNKFERPIGQGGFGPVYYGRLEDNTEVAVKIRSELSSHGLDEFFAEIATGESPILPGQGHIVQRVKKKIVAGNIILIADARFGGAYDVSSMWKVVDTALLCTTDVADQRPTMAFVAAQLKKSLALEEAREDSGFMGSTSTVSDNTLSSSTFGPSAR
ncbi:hypothetical protein E2562_034148 [Oryza meyeriana var. granulata]|uniref:Malectin-like domain-containing protein n=1 Tax=Oryza meyeriana var. granulata TaxID=110450 RepID=A0A6G1DRR8_9ORYZ|nr:hypothetical protein E2562_034148 [Oryza meyeriana var. granulata]